MFHEQRRRHALPGHPHAGEGAVVAFPDAAAGAAGLQDDPVRPHFPGNGQGPFGAGPVRCRHLVPVLCHDPSVGLDFRRRARRRQAAQHFRTDRDDFVRRIGGQCQHLGVGIVAAAVFAVDAQKARTHQDPHFYPSLLVSPEDLQLLRYHQPGFICYLIGCRLCYPLFQTFPGSTPPDFLLWHKE